LHYINENFEKTTILANLIPYNAEHSYQAFADQFIKDMKSWGIFEKIFYGVGDNALVGCYELPELQ